MVPYPYLQGYLVYLAFVVQSHVHWIGGNTTGITEAGCVTGNHHSRGGVGAEDCSEAGTPDVHFGLL